MPKDILSKGQKHKGGGGGVFYMHINNLFHYLYMILLYILLYYLSILRFPPIPGSFALLTFLLSFSKIYILMVPPDSLRKLHMSNCLASRLLTSFETLCFN